jgi:predicted NUDIX family NTP pyrophosphohydrolase
MATVSAGILMYRHGDAGLVVLLVHPGGPFWRNRDLGAWSIPKGELDDGEDPQAAARREFAEELGIEATGPLQSLGQVRQRGGKLVLAYALEGALDVSTVRSNEIAIEWPPRCPFRKSIARSGSRFLLREQRFSPASNRCSTVLRCCNAASRRYVHAPVPLSSLAPSLADKKFGAACDRSRRSVFRLTLCRGRIDQRHILEVLDRERACAGRDAGLLQRGHVCGPDRTVGRRRVRPQHGGCGSEQSNRR